MFDAIPHNAAAAGSQRAKQSRSGASLKQNFIQCRQCTEQFAKSTMVCPRCDRVNDRSSFILGLKFLAVVLFVCTVTWVVRVSASAGDAPVAERVKVMPSTPTTTSSSLASQPDLRF